MGYLFGVLIFVSIIISGCGSSTPTPPTPTPKTQSLTIKYDTYWYVSALGGCTRQGKSGKTIKKNTRVKTTGRTENCFDKKDINGEIIDDILIEVERPRTLDDLGGYIWLPKSFLE